MKKRYHALIGILLSLLFLWLAFRKVNFREVVISLGNANYFLFLLTFLFRGAGSLLRSYRWKILLSPIKNTKFSNVFSAFTIGFLTNSILPMRLGEIVRAFVIGYNEEISKSAAFATIVIERLLDIFVLLFLFSFFLAVIPFPPKIKEVSIILFSIGLFAICFLVLLLSKPGIVLELINFLPEKINIKLRTTFISFIEGLKVIKNWKLLGIVFLLSFCLWTYIALLHYMIFQVLQIELPIYAAFIVTITMCLGISLPSAPSFIGTFHYFTIIGLSIFNVPKDTALSFAILAHVMGFLPIAIIGFVCLQRMGLSLRKVTQS